jgi:hypothetical protein
LCEIKESKIVQDTPKQFHQDDKYADQIEELLKSGNLSETNFIYFYFPKNSKIIEAEKLVLQKWTFEVSHGIKNLKDDTDLSGY